MQHDDKTKPTPVHNLITDTGVTKLAEKSPINRRQFMQGMGAGMAVATTAGLTACHHGHNDDKNQPKVAFNHGVASGDPLSDKVILWTRATPLANQGQLHVSWRISTDIKFSHIVNKGTVTTQASQDFTVKVDATGLSANTSYYYQFNVDGVTSVIGQTKTLPASDAEVSQVAFAVFSCANYPAGYFNVYAEAVQRNDFDVAIHLGDYIYEYPRTTTDKNGKTVPAYASANAAKLEREVNPSNELLTLADYRTRHAQYKTDTDLQHLHGNVPMIAVWDDHEIANDAYMTGAENHQSNEGDWNSRKMAAMKAYHEWMPTRNAVLNTIYRKFDFGKLLSLHMLDTRVIGRDKQLDYQAYFSPNATTGKVEFNATQFKTDMADTKRQLLGLTQQNWLTLGMKQSTATWQVLGQQILMGRMNIPAPLLVDLYAPGQGMSFDAYFALAQKAQTAPQTLTDAEKAVLAQPSIPYNLDAWDGYAMAREAVLGAAKQLDKNLVVLSGDTHNAWANDLQDYTGVQVGVEFATSSVSSPGFEEYLNKVNPNTLMGGLPQLISGLKYTNTYQRGYMKLTVTPSECKADWIFVDTILSKTYRAGVQKTLSVKAGAGNRKLV